MALTKDERAKLDTIAEDAAAARQILLTHTDQVAELFRTTKDHETRLTTVEVTQGDCPARRRNWLAILSLLISLAMMVVGVAALVLSGSGCTIQAP